MTEDTRGRGPSDAAVGADDNGTPRQTLAAHSEFLLVHNYLRFLFQLGFGFISAETLFTYVQ